MAETTDAFSPHAELVGKMFFFIVLVLFMIFIVGFLVMGFKKPKERNYGPIKNNIIANMVTDSIKHQPVKNENLDCPTNPLKYSYAFYLNINDYYCNRGYWKCIMIKGSQVTQDAEKCTSTLKYIHPTLGQGNCKTEGLFNKDKDGYEKDKMKDLKRKIELNSKEGIKIFDNADLFKKLDIICTALQAGNDGVNMLIDAVVNCGFFKINSGEPYIMTEGTCRDFINKHKIYCNEVYAIDKKVSRQDDAERFRRIDALEQEIQNIKDAGKKEILKEEIKNLMREVETERKYDDYDSICSAENYLKKYPGLIPQTVEVYNENDLINLSKKNNMDLIHTIDDAVNLEGCYPLEGDEQNEKIKITDENKLIELQVTDLIVPDNIIQQCNRAAEENGYEYYGIQEQAGTPNKLLYCYGFQKSDLILLQTKRTDEDKPCNREERKSADSGYIYVSKVVHPAEHIVSDCWAGVINKYPYQSPGVWLHPFVNNIRVIFTTNTPEEYSRHINDQTHANPGNDFNKEVKKVAKPQPEHAGAEKYQEDKSCPNSTIPSANNYYRESFDILNVPINNEFHLALVINDHIVEVYIDGTLKQSIKLFGEPTFNQGDLHINPENKPKLGGKVTQFQFFPVAIDYNNIQKIIEMKTARQNLGREPVAVSQNHGHMIEISHEHEYHPQEESNHKHTIDGSSVLDYT